MQKKGEKVGIMKQWKKLTIHNAQYTITGEANYVRPFTSLIKRKIMFFIHSHHKENLKF